MDESKITKGGGTMKRFQVRSFYGEWHDVSENRMYEHALLMMERATKHGDCVEYFVDRYTRVIEED